MFATSVSYVHLGFGYGVSGFVPQVKLYGEISHLISHGYCLYNSDDGSIPSSLQ